MMLSTMQTSNHLVRQNLESWQLFMSNSEKWMGNVENCALLRLTPTSIFLFKEKISRVQQLRSYNMHLLQKNDIWDTKNWFRNEVSHIIKENNLKCKTMQELEKIVLSKVKSLILYELPNKGFVDGPWKILTERLASRVRTADIST